MVLESSAASRRSVLKLSNETEAAFWRLDTSENDSVNPSPNFSKFAFSILHQRPTIQSGIVRIICYFVLIIVVFTSQYDCVISSERTNRHGLYDEKNLGLFPSRGTRLVLATTLPRR